MPTLALLPPPTRPVLTKVRKKDLGRGLHLTFDAPTSYPRSLHTHHCWNLYSSHSKRRQSAVSPRALSGQGRRAGCRRDFGGAEEEALWRALQPQALRRPDPRCVAVLLSSAVRQPPLRHFIDSLTYISFHAGFVAARGEWDKPEVKKAADEVVGSVIGLFDTTLK